MNFKVFYYDDYAGEPLNNHNPRFVMSQIGVMDIIERITTAEPYTIGKADITNKELLKQLLSNDVLKEKDGQLAMDVPFFLEKDLDKLKKLSQKKALRIAEILAKRNGEIESIVSCIKNGYSSEVNLYHILCGQIFDGKMFDYLEVENLVTTSKIHSSGLDYLMILYEESEKLSAYSDSLICSFNCLKTPKGTFSSFGDSKGNRKDLYRFCRRMEAELLTEEEKKFAFSEPEVLSQKYNELLDGGSIEEEYLALFEYFDYVKNGQACVPVYDATAKIVVEEIYHLIFGTVNEILVEKGMVAKPYYREGEGRYLKCYERIS